jgi:hypothetical protein
MMIPPYPSEQLFQLHFKQDVDVQQTGYYFIRWLVPRYSASALQIRNLQSLEYNYGIKFEIEKPHSLCRTLQCAERGEGL